MRVRLDPEAKTLDGAERIIWRNPSSEPVGELWFHLYLNAFKNSKSTFFRGVGRPAARRPDARRRLGLRSTSSRSVRTDGADLAPGATFEHPDDGNADDRTVWRVPLPTPVPPGGDDRARRRRSARSCRGSSRAPGYFRDYFLVGQWFPKLARLRARRHCAAARRRLELPPVPRELGVLRGLRALPGRDHAAAATTWWRDRDRARSAATTRTGPSTHVFEQQGRDRLRLDGLTALRRGEARFSGEHDVTRAGVRRDGERSSAGASTRCASATSR